MTTLELKQIADDLRTLADRIDDAIAAQVPIPQAVKDAVADAVEKRRCLQCGKRVPDSARYIRGLCHADYQKTYRWIGSGVAKESSLMLAGKLAEETPSGRPKSKRDQQLLRELESIEASNAALGAVRESAMSVGANQKPPKTKPPTKRKPVQ